MRHPKLLQPRPATETSSEPIFRLSINALRAGAGPHSHFV
jgi:hypothetical protein